MHSSLFPSAAEMANSHLVCPPYSSQPVSHLSPRKATMPLTYLSVPSRSRPRTLRPCLQVLQSLNGQHSTAPRCDLRPQEQQHLPPLQALRAQPHCWQGSKISKKAAQHLEKVAISGQARTAARKSSQSLRRSVSRFVSCLARDSRCCSCSVCQ
jgi:hypothetical protein